MTVWVPTQVASLVTKVRNILSHTRAATDDEIIAGLDFGYQKGLRALQDVRPQAFLNRVDSFVLPANTQFVDVGDLLPPLTRPVAIHSTSSSRGYRFRYRALMDPEFEQYEGRSAAFGSGVIDYDVVSDHLIVEATTQPGSMADALILDTTVGMRSGHRIRIESVGPAVAVGDGLLQGNYDGVIQAVGVLGSVISLSPPLELNPPDGTVVRVFSSRVLVLAQQLGSGVTGRLYYQYQPEPLTRMNQHLDSRLVPFGDMIIYYALAQLAKAVDDSQATFWFQEAQEMRSELMQNMEPLSAQNSEALSSALFGTD